MTLPAQIERFVADYCQPTTRIVIGLSGGVDSVVLLDLLAKSTVDNQQIIAVHVNHGLNKLAHNWGLFCQQLCENYAITFALEPVHLTSASNLEAQARQARYQALAKYISSDDVLVTAQHLDDQAETVLLALKRGAGVLGLAAMPSSLAFNQGRHNRPLLNIGRKEIEHYAHRHQLHWIEDDSNLDCRFDRNYLRHQIMPKLNQRWQGFSENLARSASLLGQSIELLDELAVIDYDKVQAASGGLLVAVVGGLSAARQNNVIRYWLRQHQLVMPSQAQLQQITAQMLTATLDSDPIVEVCGAQIRRYQGVMMVVTPQPDISEQVIAWRGEPTISLPNQLGKLEFSQHHYSDHKDTESHGIAKNDCTSPNIDRQTLVRLIAPRDRQVEIRFSVVGSYKAWPIGRDKRRVVKKLWQEFNIPTWQRSQIPLVFFDQQLVAALGVWVEQGYQGCINQPNVVIRWHKFD